MRIVEWKEQVTETGIQLAENTAVIKRGELLSTHAFPAMDAAGRQGTITLVVIRAFENGRIMSMPSDACRYVDEDMTTEPLRKSSNIMGC